MTLRDLKKAITRIEIGYDYESAYRDLYNTVIDYMNESQDWDFEDLFEEYIDYDLAEELAKRELEDGGLVRLYYFLGDINPDGYDMFRLNAYGNLEAIDKDDLEYLKDEILDRINDKEDEDEDDYDGSEE